MFDNNCIVLSGTKKFKTITYPFFYKVRVIEVIDSTAITKIYSKEPFVKIRKGDVVSIR